MFRVIVIFIAGLIFIASLDAIKAGLSNLVLRGSDWIIANCIHIISPMWWLALTFVITTMIFTSGRLKSFEKPTWPRASNIVRFLSEKAHPPFKISGLCVAASGFLASAGYSLACWLDPSLFSSDGMTAIQAYLDKTSVEHTAQAIGAAAGLIVSIFLNFFIVPSFIRKGNGPNTRETLDALRNAPQFNPGVYMSQDKGLFIGRDLNKRPIYVPWRKVDETHMQIMGSTGAGKGVSLSLMGVQFVQAGKTVIVFDPKGDAHSKSIFYEAATANGREFIFIDLNQQIPQINPFSKTTPQEAADLLIAAFELRGQGSDGDYYKGREEDCAYSIADAGIESLPHILGKAHSDPVVREEENFLRKLRKLERSRVFMTDDGPDLEEKIQSGAVIYVECSAGGEAVSMAQKLLLLRIMQIIKARKDKSRSVAVILDEFKYMLSPAALMALGLMRSSNCHCLLAFQAIGDLADNPSLNETAAKSAVLTNTAIKIIFRIPEVQYAEELSRMTVENTRFDEITGKQPDEVSKGTGSWREVHEPSIAVSLLTNLPMPTDHADKTISCGVVFIGSEATPFSTSPVIHKNSAVSISPAPCPALSIKTEDLI